MTEKSGSRSHPEGVPVPTHLADWLGPLDWFDDDPYIEGDLICPCGQDEFELRYLGKTHHPRAAMEPIPCVLQLPDSEGNAQFWFIIEAACRACGQQKVVFDKHLHGICVFLAPNNEDRQSPPLVPWQCSECGSTSHRGRVHFRFGFPGEFLKFVGNACGLERWGDGFEWFGMDIECCQCGHQVSPWVGYETG